MGKLEDASLDACDHAEEHLWVLIWRDPATLKGLTALFAHFRDHDDGCELLGNEWREELNWTIECAVRELTGLPKSPMNNIVRRWHEKLNAAQVDERAIAQSDMRICEPSQSRQVTGPAPCRTTTLFRQSNAVCYPTSAI